jgi:hypothetical protein
LNTTPLTRRIARTVIALYVITAAHHVIEGVGWVFEFRLKSLITPATFGVPLIMTLGLLLLYNRTRHALVLTVLAGTTFLWWVFGIGLSDGLYNHTLNLVLSAAHVPSSILSAIYPSYVAPPAGGALTIACDGVRYSYCSITPATVAYEAAGIASFVVACSLTVDVYRLVRQHRRDLRAPSLHLPRRILTGVSFGMVASFGVAPTLGMYMASGQPTALAIAVAFMAVGVGALAVAVTATRAQPTARDEAPSVRHGTA